MRRSTADGRRAVADDGPRVITLRNGGGNRGARAMLRAVQEVNTRSTATALHPLYADPFPGRGNEIVTEARALGIPARSVEAKIEDVIEREGPTEISPIVLNVDDPAAIGRTLQRVEARSRPVLGYALARVPSTETFYGFRWVLRGGDETDMQLGARFFAKLAEVTARGGSRHVLGDRGRPEHRAAEALYRRWFSEHFQQNLARVVADVPSEASPFELTSNGTTTEPLFLRDVPDGNLDPLRLAQDLVAHPPIPLLRGQDFSLGVILPQGVSILRVGLRRDGRLTFRGGAVIDLAAIAAAEAEVQAAVRRAAEAREAARRDAERRAAEEQARQGRAAEARDALARVLTTLITRAERSTVSDTQPAWFTD